MTQILELNQLIARAKAGYNETQFELGQPYAKVTGVAQDDVVAAEPY